MIRVLSLGAGVQSTTVLLMSCRGVLPKLDHAIFADTQWEPKAVYRHLDWLEGVATKHGIQVHRVTAGNLRQDAIEFRQYRKSLDGKRYASMPVFVQNPDGSGGIVRRQCTKEYKIQPVERCIRRTILGLKPHQRAPKTPVIEHWFGISADEVYRVRSPDNSWEVFRYPLIWDVTPPVKDQLFDRGFYRQDCLDWLESHGYPRPPRSACIGCPFHDDDEWINMKTNDPESWADAVAFDYAMRDANTKGVEAGKILVGEPYLHRSLVPLDMVDLKPGRGQGSWSQECQGMCGV